MAEGSTIIPDEVNVLTYDGIYVGTLTLVGASTQPIRIYLVQNLTDTQIDCNMDGSNVIHFILPPGGFLLLDAGTNKGTPNTASIPQGYGAWVQASSTYPTLGQVNFSYWYAR